jgi:peptidoglycan hydrolase CwlO-like protein
MRSKMAMRFALISAIFFISLAMVFAETTSQTDQSLMAGQNATLNETINQTTNMTPDLANIFKKVKGIPVNESER